MNKKGVNEWSNAKSIGLRKFSQSGSNYKGVKGNGDSVCGSVSMDSMHKTVPNGGEGLKKTCKEGLEAYFKWKLV